MTAIDSESRTLSLITTWDRDLAAKLQPGASVTTRLLYRHDMVELYVEDYLLALYLLPPTTGRVALFSSIQHATRYKLSLPAKQPLPDSPPPIRALRSACSFPHDLRGQQCDMDIGHQTAAKSAASCAEACCANKRCSSWNWGNYTCGNQHTSGCGCWLGAKNENGRATGCGQNAAWIGGSRVPPANAPTPPATTQCPVDVWPAPRAVSCGAEEIPRKVCASNFHATCTGGAASACESIVQPAVQRMRSAAFYLRNACPHDTPPFELTIVLNSSQETPLQHGVEEAYTLTIDAVAGATQARIEAANQWGSLHGLNTLGQLVRASADRHHEISASLPLRIEDGPRVRWRSLLVDTSRHFLSPAILKRAVDTMAASHLNVLHWHATDDASFPLCLDDSLPGACESNTYRDPWGVAMTYGKQWLKEFVQYATARGVRIMVELDLPAHSMSLWRARPELFVQDCPAAQWSRAPSARFPNEEQPLPDVSNPEWWGLLRSMVTEIAEIFPEAYFHGGADEVNPGCWEKSATTRRFMAKQGLKTSLDVVDYFHQRYQQIVADANRTMMYWDGFWWKYGADASRASWSNFSVLRNTTAATIRGITDGHDAAEWNATLARGIPAVSTGLSEAWYLDRGSYYSSVDYVHKRWETYYHDDPFAAVSAEFLESGLLLGGEVDMWGEGVDDTNFEQRVSTSLTAVAEIMWGGPRPIEDARARLTTQRCRLVRAGVRAAPVGQDSWPYYDPPCGPSAP